MKEILAKIKEKWYWVPITLLVALCVALAIYAKRMEKKAKEKVEPIEYVDSTGTYNQIYYEGKFNELKKKNKELYDSLKIYKDKIDYLVQFTYENQYNTGQVTTPTGNNATQEEKEEAKTYEYQGELGDTFKYKLTLNSLKEPNWYNISASVKEKFTIVNKDNGSGNNHITIGTGGNGTVSDVTVFKKKKAKDYIAIGPSVTAGYDPFRKEFGILVGGSVTIDLW